MERTTAVFTAYDAIHKADLEGEIVRRAIALVDGPYAGYYDRMLALKATCDELKDFCSQF